MRINFYFGLLERYLHTWKYRIFTCVQIRFFLVAQNTVSHWCLWNKTFFKINNCIAYGGWVPESSGGFQFHSLPPDRILPSRQPSHEPPHQAPITLIRNFNLGTKKRNKTNVYLFKGEGNTFHFSMTPLRHATMINTGHASNVFLRLKKSAEIILQITGAELKLYREPP